MTINHMSHTVVQNKIDPVTLQIIGGALKTIMQRNGPCNYRMAYSSLIRESEDLGAGVFNKFGHTIAEADSTPMQLGCLPGYIQGSKVSRG